MNLKKIKSTTIRLSVIAATLLSTACATTYTVDPDLVSQFKPETTPSQEETFVYVIRGSNFQGGARGVWVAANENVVADLSNGSHALLKLDSGINSVHMVQGLVGFGYAKVDNKPGDTVYLVIDYTTGKIKEVNYDLGASMIMQTTKVDVLDEPRKNDAYDNLLVNPSILGFPVMKKTDEIIRADDKSAVINFYRMSTLGGEIPFDIWSQDGYVGSTTSGTYFQVRVSPGTHTFLALSERYSVLEANVEAGKEYFVEFDVDMGWNQAHVQLLPVDTKESEGDIKKWQEKAQLMAVDASVVQQDAFNQRIKAAQTYLKNQYEKINAGDVTKRHLDNKHAAI